MKPKNWRLMKGDDIKMEGWHCHRGKERHYFVNKNGFYRSLCAKVLLFSPISTPFFDEKDEDYNCVECKALLEERRQEPTK